MGTKPDRGVPRMRREVHAEEEPALLLAEVPLPAAPPRGGTAVPLALADARGAPGVPTGLVGKPWKMSPGVRRCPTCGREFEAHNGKHLYCCKDCCPSRWTRWSPDAGMYRLFPGLSASVVEMRAAFMASRDARASGSDS